MARKVVRKTTQRDIFVKELLAFERRLDTRIERRFENQTESLKVYVDGRFSQINERFDAIEKRFDALNRKLDMRTDGLVDLIERGFGEIVTYGAIFKNHENRISVLEQRR